MEGNGRAALWLRWRPPLRRRALDKAEDGRDCRGRGGDEESSVETSSALPSRERESRTFDEGVEIVEAFSRSGHDDGSCGSKLKKKLVGFY